MTEIDKISTYKQKQIILNELLQIMDSVEPFIPLWEDKEIKFDTPNIQKRLRNGEKISSTIYYIEDTKGNPGNSGRLLATNLRLIWYSLVHKKFNLSIGYGRIANMNTKTVTNNKRGNCLALYILAIGGSTRFEFLFTDISGDTERNKMPIFQTIFDIYHLYQRTYLYRDLKLRGAILQSGRLVILPQEQVFNKVDGVWNLSSDQGNLGSFVISNIRIVWYADANETFNISLPYIQIANIRIRESKYGPALVIQTIETAGGYVLGFRIDPPERLMETFQELVSLHSVYTENPNFGIAYEASDMERQSSSTSVQRTEMRIEEFEEIDERQEKEINTKLNTYLAEGSLTVHEDKPSREPVYCKELGFAMERIRDGYKLKDLWDVLPQHMIVIEEE